MNTLNRYANTSKVEEYLYSVLNGTVSDQVFAGTLPTAIGESWNSMVLIDCDLPMTDFGPYSSATVYIYLYARPNANGPKNVPVLAKMEDDLCDVLDSIQNAHYDTTLQWHRNYVYFNLVITK